MIARATAGLAVLVLAAQLLAVLAGWWSPPWAVVTAGVLIVVALGLLVQAVRGRSLTLIGPGVVLSVVTVLLTVTGFTGSPAFGDLDAAPTSAGEVRSEYRLTAGTAELDLSGLELSDGETVVTSLDLGAGDATVTLPKGVAYTVTCSSTFGDVTCLDHHAEGVVPAIGPLTGASGNSTGSIVLDVRVGAGDLTVQVAP